jgi:hypothetical protein
MPLNLKAFIRRTRKWIIWAIKVIRDTRDSGGGGGLPKYHISFIKPQFNGLNAKREQDLVGCKRYVHFLSNSILSLKPTSLQIILLI